MITLNKVFLVGNLARDPDLRHTPSGTPVTEFRLAVSDSYTTSSGEKHDRTCFIDVVSWRKLAESCAEYLKKGSPVFVEGRLEQDTWTTGDGQRRSRIRVVAYSVQFIRREVERSASGRHIRIVERGGDTVRDESDNSGDDDDLSEPPHRDDDSSYDEDVGDDVTLD
ncbi:MAG: single-stranded DNA-binding protein [Planctomycetes bacterium]|nr:single-stranded DNA-binding protein [Planctomycetota bacterium]MCA8934921.1 single-stranded DNA-binding protein [Planctomycetota bacterium]MCA8945465.1 single-stranded DNA-binding protein [Planctomycetota bacterium]